MKKQHFLVTGGNGFLGRHLIARLRHGGTMALIIDSLCTGNTY